MRHCSQLSPNTQKGLDLAKNYEEAQQTQSDNTDIKYHRFSSYRTEGVKYSTGVESNKPVAYNENAGMRTVSKHCYSHQTVKPVKLGGGAEQTLKKLSCKLV